MQTTTLQEVLRKYPKVDAAEMGKFLDELDQLPRRKKRRYRIARPGTRRFRLAAPGNGVCPRCISEALRRRNGCSGHS